MSLKECVDLLEVDHCCSVANAIYLLACFLGDIELATDARFVQCTEVKSTEGFWVACRYGRLNLVKNMCRMYTPQEACRGLRNAADNKQYDVVRYLLTSHTYNHGQLLFIADIIASTENLKLITEFCTDYPEAKDSCLLEVFGAANDELCVGLLDLVTTTESRFTKADIYNTALNSKADNPRFIHALREKFQLDINLQAGLECAYYADRVRLAVYFIKSGAVGQLNNTKRDNTVYAMFGQLNDTKMDSTAYAIYRLVNDTNVFVEVVRSKITKMEKVRNDMGTVLPISSDLVNHIFELIYPTK